VIPLRVLDAQRPQALDGESILDALGDGHEPEASRQLHDGPHDLLAAGVGQQITHELAVDLQTIDGESFEVAEATVAGAEVIECAAAAQGSHAIDECRRDLLVVHQRGFGDLERNQCRVRAGLRQLTLHAITDVGIAKRPSGDVHLHGVSPSGVADCLAQDPAVDLRDEAVALGDRQERIGGDQAAILGDHADQQLVLYHRLVLELDDRLCEQHEPLVGQGETQRVQLRRLLVCGRRPRLGAVHDLPRIPADRSRVVQ